MFQMKPAGHGFGFFFLRPSIVDQRPSMCDGLSSLAFYHHIQVTYLGCFMWLAIMSSPNSGDTRFHNISNGAIEISHCFMYACTLVSWHILFFFFHGSAFEKFSFAEQSSPFHRLDCYCSLRRSIALPRFIGAPPLCHFREPDLSPSLIESKLLHN